MAEYKYYYLTTSSQWLRWFWLSFWKYIGFCCQKPSGSSQEHPWLSCLCHQWRFGNWKADFGSLIMYPEFSLRVLLLFVFPPKDSLKAVVMVLRWQVRTCLRAIQKHKWCVYHITCYKLGSWSKLKKENLTWNVCVGGKKGLSRMPWNKQKIIQHFSALFIKAMVLGFEVFCFSQTFISFMPVFINNYINVTF